MRYVPHRALTAFAAAFTAMAGTAAHAGSPMTPDNPILPNGYAWLVSLACGPGRTMAGQDGVSIAQSRGHQRQTGAASGPEAECAWDSARVEFTVSGLDTAADYLLGFTWFAPDVQGRRLSVQLAPGDSPAWKTVLPATVPAAFHADQPVPARVLLPIAGASLRDGKLRLAIVNETGPDACVNEIWLLKKTDSTPRKRILIVTGDDYPGHRWQETGPELAAILRQDPRLEVSITECPAILASPLMDHYDAALIHFKNYSARLPLGEDIWSGFRRYADSGHGLVFVHFACGAFEDWNGYVRIAGRVWDPKLRAHDPYGPFSVRIVDPDHSVTNAMQPFDTTDELYTCLAGDTPIHTLCEAVSNVDQLAYPMAFTVPELKGRVLHCTLGHDTNALVSPGARALYRRAAAWAAGLDSANHADIPETR